MWSLATQRRRFKLRSYNKLNLKYSAFCWNEIVSHRDNDCWFDLSRNLCSSRPQSGSASLEIMSELLVCYQQTERSTSFLWRIAADPPSYFFGTIHVPYSRVWDYVPDNVKRAFDASDAVFFELDLTDPYTISALTSCQLLPVTHSIDFAVESRHSRFRIWSAGGSESGRHSSGRFIHSPQTPSRLRQERHAVVDEPGPKRSRTLCRLSVQRHYG